MNMSGGVFARRVISEPPLRPNWPLLFRKFRRGLLCFMWLLNSGEKLSPVEDGNCYGMDLSIAMRRPYK